MVVVVVLLDVQNTKVSQYFHSKVKVVLTVTFSIVNSVIYYWVSLHYFVTLKSNITGFAIELVTFAVDFVPLAVGFSTFAVEFIGFAIDSIDQCHICPYMSCFHINIYNSL